MSEPQKRIPRWAAALLAGLLFALACASLQATRESHFDGSLESDEPEWIAVSILHLQQLTHGDPAPGAEHPAGNGADPNPWKRGFQHATFGAANPCLPKLVWGSSLHWAGHRQASFQVFQRFHGANPQLDWQARQALLPAAPLARRVLLGFTAACAVLLFFIARQIGGWPSGLIAYGLWLAAPLVQRWANYIRPDFMMVALSLATLLLALNLRRSLSGRRGALPMALASALLGLLAGLVIATKFNGTLIVFAVALWIPLLWWSSRREHGVSFLRGPCVALLAAALTAGLVVWALNPVLWSNPVGEMREILSFWGQHMAYQQDRAEAGGVLVARTLGEKLSLTWQRVALQDEPLRALTGLPGGVLLLLGGAAVLALCALGLPRVLPGDREGSKKAWILGIYLTVICVGSTLWLPLEWDRYFFATLACAILLEATLIGALVHQVAHRRTGAHPPPTHPG